MFFYLKCKEDKICGFSSSVFLKEKTSYPSPVQDLAKELSATKVLKCLTLSKNCGESPPEAHNFGYLPSPPFPFSYQAGTGAGFEKSQGVLLFFFCHCIFMAEHQESIWKASTRCQQALKFCLSPKS